jgi:formylglycine-generating enzyme required for sulfatase activity
MANLTPGSDVGAVMGVSLASITQRNGYCTIAKVYWDAFSDGTIDDSTTGVNALTWTWLTQVPTGAAAQRRTVIARAVDKNGLSSAPCTLTVQFGLQRPIVMKDIPSGTFTMGSNNIADWGAEPSHQVTLSAFAMQETKVTQEQYMAVMDTNPSHLITGTDAPLRPVENVSWYDAVKYCNTLSLLSGLTVVYDTSTWTADFSKTGYRVPTEAQWEYTCRAGSSTEFWWGGDTNGMGARAWSNYNSGNTTHPVATKLANVYGLYDMVGDVWEWCNDWYGDYSADSATDPTGAASGTHRVLHGGSWSNEIIDYSGAFRSAARNPTVPDTWVDYNGFRIALPR